MFRTVTNSLFESKPLTSSFAAVILTAATRGHCFTVNINMGGKRSFVI